MNSPVDGCDPGAHRVEDAPADVVAQSADRGQFGVQTVDDRDRRVLVEVVDDQDLVRRRDAGRQGAQDRRRRLALAVYRHHDGQLGCGHDWPAPALTGGASLGSVDGFSAVTPTLRTATSPRSANRDDREHVGEHRDRQDGLRRRPRQRPEGHCPELVGAEVPAGRRQGRPEGGPQRDRDRGGRAELESQRPGADPDEPDVTHPREHTEPVGQQRGAGADPPHGAEELDTGVAAATRADASAAGEQSVPRTARREPGR